MQRKIVVMQLVAVMVFLVMLGGCKKGGSSYSTPTGPSNPPPASSSPTAVLIQNFQFAPSPITVAKGSTITWTNKDAVAHTATADDGSWDTGNIAPGASKSLTFANSGTFAYHCTVHPMMKSSVVVQ